MMSNKVRHGIEESRAQIFVKYPLARARRFLIHFLWLEKALWHALASVPHCTSVLPWLATMGRASVLVRRSRLSFDGIFHRIASAEAASCFSPNSLVERITRRSGLL